MIIASAQTVPENGDVSYNIERHIELIQRANEKGVELIVFPELSLTGYEPELAKSLAFQKNDNRLEPMIEIAHKTKMIIIVGAPVQIKEKLHIGAFIIYPDKSVSIYTKRYLHPGEEKYFDPGEFDPQIKLNGHTISLAICADISNPLHPQSASNKGADLYLAGVLCTPNGYKKDVDMLKDYAQKYGMLVMMTNFGGNSGGYEAAGGSIIISKNGKEISRVDGKGEGLAYAKFENNEWIKI